MQNSRIILAKVFGGGIMCDTFVALSNSTYNSSVLFAKNSDREPNEPHIIVGVPGKKYEKGGKLKCTYIDIEQAEETYGVLLFKPSWIWGAEMGVNEYGLVIGNEAVFTKEKQGPPALLGMDILRLCLERCRTAKEAVDYIVHLIENYGQGGKCGYTQNLKYDNSYIIADYSSAYVVETAGKNWAVERVKDIRSISNSLSIEGEIESCSYEALRNASGKGLCRNKEDFNFKKCFEDRLVSHFTCGDIRHRRTEDMLRRNTRKIDAKYMMDILRLHDEKHENPFRRGSMKDICMHGGGIVSSQTTGSVVVELKGGDIKVWATGSSLPCMSVFKPMWFTKNYDILFNEDNKDELIRIWSKRETLRRMVLENRIDNLDRYINEKNCLESELFEKAGKAQFDEEREELTKFAFKKEDEILDNYINQGKNKRSNIKGSLYFKHYWRKQNKEFNMYIMQ